MPHVLVENLLVYGWCEHREIQEKDLRELQKLAQSPSLLSYAQVPVRVETPSGKRGRENPSRVRMEILFFLEGSEVEIRPVITIVEFGMLSANRLIIQEGILPEAMINNLQEGIGNIELSDILDIDVALPPLKLLKVEKFGSTAKLGHVLTFEDKRKPWHEMIEAVEYGVRLKGK